MIQTIRALQQEAEKLPPDPFAHPSGRPQFRGDELVKFAPLIVLALKLARIFTGERARARIDAVIFWLSLIRNEKNPLF